MRVRPSKHCENLHTNTIECQEQLIRQVKVFPSHLGCLIRFLISSDQNINKSASLGNGEGFYLGVYRKDYVDAITPRLAGGGGLFRAPSRFSAIVARPMNRSSQNSQYLQIHQFYIICVKKEFAPIVGRPKMTSELRHV